jgi:hypothetical protein
LELDGVGLAFSPAAKPTVLRTHGSPAPNG